MDNLTSPLNNVSPSDMDSETGADDRKLDRRALLRLGGSAAALGAAAAIMAPAAAAGASTGDAVRVTYGGAGDAILGEAAKPAGTGWGGRGIAIGGARGSGASPRGGARGGGRRPPRAAPAPPPPVSRGRAETRPAP